MALKKLNASTVKKLEQCQMRSCEIETSYIIIFEKEQKKIAELQQDLVAEK